MIIRRRLIPLFVLALILVVVAGVSSAQKPRRTNPPKKSHPVASPTATPTAAKPTPVSTPEPAKRNERPNSDKISSDDTQGDQPLEKDGVPTGKAPFTYEFTRPEFPIDKIVIEHDGSGKGRIFFQKKDHDEMLSDPIQISPSTIDKLNATFAALDFINSTESYQYEKDYSHLGNASITLRKDGRERTAKYNWTENKDAKALMDEYRRIANQYLWIFDVNLARENQPLDTPRLVDTFESYISLNEIADPRQMIPFLTTLSNDERVPLIARNHAMKIIKKIEKRKN